MGGIISIDKAYDVLNAIVISKLLTEENSLVIEPITYKKGFKRNHIFIKNNYLDPFSGRIHIVVDHKNQTIEVDIYRKSLNEISDIDQLLKFNTIKKCVDGRYRMWWNHNDVVSFELRNHDEFCEFINIVKEIL